jgi:tRNA G18 (ribose-2'-O)-methylase SpoU
MAGEAGPMTQDFALVGDSIENPGNVQTMLDAARMFGARCVFLDTESLEAAGGPGSSSALDLPGVTDEELRTAYPRRIAFDNLSGAVDVYGFQPGPSFAVLVGNERRGLSHTTRRLATDAVQVPMISKRINCLNVAAASAVALYYLGRGGGGPMRVRQDPGSRRPELLLVGGADAVELGSAIRSAAAFGWTRALLEDREGAWFGSERSARALGRAAARQSRNTIRLIPSQSKAELGFAEVTVITLERRGVPLHRAHLAGGARQLVVVQDETHASASAEDWSRLGAGVSFVHLDVPGTQFPYHYRLVATVALAEISRQLGRRTPEGRRPRRPQPFYDRTLERLAETAGEDLALEDLLQY